MEATQQVKEVIAAALASLALLATVGMGRRIPRLNSRSNGYVL
jgi:hypothetical protein